MHRRLADELQNAVHVERDGRTLHLAVDRPVGSLRVAAFGSELDVVPTDAGFAVEIPAEPRPLLDVALPDGARHRAAERRLPLDGPTNFRDLGGYPAADGHRVRWGCLFRADSLYKLTERDMAYLERLGLASVCDLRGEAELDEEPNPLADRDAFQYRHDALGGHAVQPSEWRRRFETGDLGDLDSTWLARSYCEMLDQCAATFQRIVTSFAEAGALPVVFHCTAGKDRTGILAALLLSWLGVPRSVVLADYALTGHFTGGRDEDFAAQLRERGIDPKKVMALFSSEPFLMEIALDRLEAEYGGADRYLREHAEVPAEALEALRRELLEGP
jgi:protein-tyrosine phosphatase